MSDADKGPKRRKNADGRTLDNGWTKAGIGVGIGSAAIAAALLYVNHARRKAKNIPPKPTPEDHETD